MIDVAFCSNFRVSASGRTTSALYLSHIPTSYTLGTFSNWLTPLTWVRFTTTTPRPPVFSHTGDTRAHVPTTRSHQVKLHGATPPSGMAGKDRMGRTRVHVPTAQRHGVVPPVGT